MASSVPFLTHALLQPRPAASLKCLKLLLEKLRDGAKSVGFKAMEESQAEDNRCVIPWDALMQCRACLLLWLDSIDLKPCVDCSVLFWSLKNRFLFMLLIIWHLLSNKLERDSVA